MPLTTFSSNSTARASEVNANFALCVLTDTSRTISVTHTYTASQTFTGGFTTGAATTFGAAVTVSTGGLTVTAGGVTVSAGGATVTGNSTVNGTLTLVYPDTIGFTLNRTGSADPIFAFNHVDSGGHGWLLIQNSSTGTSTFWIGAHGVCAFGGATATSPALKPSGTTLKARLADDSADAPFSCAALTASSTITVSAGGITVTAGGLTVSAGTTAVQALTATTGTFTGIISPGVGKIGNGTLVTAITVAKTIYTLTAGAVGTVIVQGDDGSNFFADIVSFANGGSALVHSGGTIFGAPAVRTYSVTGGALKVAMASGTYQTKVLPFEFA